MTQKSRYGSFLQDGGMQAPQAMPVDAMIQGDPAAQAAPPQQDPQAIAQEFLAVFQQLPPEAQQLIAQAIMEMAQTQ